MTTVLLADQLPQENDSFYLLSWFGTFLSSKQQYDWIEHRTLVSDPTENSLLYVTLKREQATSCQLLKRLTAPRALPQVMIIRQERCQVALRCIKSADSQDLLNHLVTAVPGGEVEMNRTNISHWETYLLLSALELNNLYEIMFKRALKAQLDSEQHLSLYEGFILKAGQTIFDVRDLLKRKLLQNPDPPELLVDIEGNEVELRQICFDWQGSGGIG